MSPQAFPGATSPRLPIGLEAARTILWRIAAGIILWYAIWTATVSALVLSGILYAILPWCLLSTTGLTVLAWHLLRRFGMLTAAPLSGTAAVASGPSLKYAFPIPLAAVLLVAGAGVLAVGVHLLSGAVALIGATAVIAVGGYLLAPMLPAAVPERSGAVLLIKVAVLAALLVTLYLFGHRPDWDDANYVNLAVGAQRTAADVFALDTMVGDGPNPIHLPTYRLQTYELLAAALSTATGLAPIAVLHLVLPVPELVLFAIVLALAFGAVVGRDWLAAALVTTGILYLNTTSLGAWGFHGPLRFFQGKGALVTTLPLLAVALTVAFLCGGRRINLIALGLVHVCAVGLSANGIFVTPAASAFAAAAVVAADPAAMWRRSLALVPTLVWPIAMAAAVLAFDLALPSEVTEETFAFSQYRFVTGWRWDGLLITALAPLVVLAWRTGPLRRAAALYLPLALLFVMNPVGWHAVAALTGNLGFRIFWSLPAAAMIGLVLVRLLRGVTGGDRLILAVALAFVPAGVIFNAATAGSDLRIAWRAPGLRVDPADYAAAQTLARRTPAGCTALVPERVSTWIAGLPNGPHLVTVRSLYLQHYRFSMPADELRARWALFGHVDAEPGHPPLPPPAQLRAFHLGLVASEESNPDRASVAGLAKRLALSGPFRGPPGFVYWQGACMRGREQAAAGRKGV